MALKRQTVTISVTYNDTESDAPETWDWTNLDPSVLDTIAFVRAEGEPTEVSVGFLLTEAGTRFGRRHVGR